MADILGKIAFYKTSEGGRKSAISADWLGCIFEFEGEYFDCRLILEGIGLLEPGARATIPIAFLNPQLIKPNLKVGSRFTLWEGKTIAEGEVVEIF